MSVGGCCLGSFLYGFLLLRLLNRRQYVSMKCESMWSGVGVRLYRPLYYTRTNSKHTGGGYRTRRDSKSYSEQKFFFFLSALVGLLVGAGLFLSRPLLPVGRLIIVVAS